MKLFRFVLPFLFALLLVSCSTGNKPDVSEVTSPSPTPEVTPVPSDDYRKELTIEQSSKYPGVDIASDIDWQKDYHHAVHYPLTADADTDQELRQMIDDRILLYKEKLKDRTEPANEEQVPELLIDFEIKYMSDQFFTVLFSENTYLGGANPEVALFAANISLTENKILSLSDLFVPESDFLVQLSQLSRDGLLHSGQLGDFYEADWVEKGTAPSEDNFKIFTIEKEGITLHFDMYQVAARAAGPQQIQLTYLQLNDIVREGRVPYAPIPPAEPSPEPSIVPTESPVAPKPSDKTGNGKKRIALTFDDGPHKKVTPQVLDTLKEKGGKATFFVLGNRVGYYPEIMQRIVDEGHELGNHSWNHSQLTRLKKDAIQEQFTKTQQAVFDAVGIWPGLIRPPYGAYDDTVKALAGLPLVMWSVDTLDWKHRDKNKVIKAALSGARDGGIILFHDMYTSTADAIGPIMDKLAADGYEFVTVSELLGFDPAAEPAAGKVYHSAKSSKE